MKVITRSLLTLAAMCFAALLSTSTALASPPSPDADPNCGGNCQAICINGCDTNSSYMWQEARCAGPHPTGYADKAYAASLITDSNGNLFCSDGYNCDYGPCGRAGERTCNTGLCDECYWNGMPGTELVAGGDGKCHKLYP